MAVYEYKGFDLAGKESSGIVDADTARGARAKLRRQGVFPTEVWEQKGGRGAMRGRGLAVEVDVRRFFERVKLQDIARAIGNLATLVGAGIPVVEALSAVVEQVENPALERVLLDVREQVNQGDSLARAMERHPKVFTALHVNMVAAGEQSGALDNVLERLAEYTEAQVALRSKLVGALTYPVLMGCVGGAIVAGLFLGVIPKIRRIFDSFDMALPLVTRILLGLSDFLVGWWWALLLGMAAALWRFVKWTRSPEGRRRWHRVKLVMPIFGKINRLVAVSRFCRTLSTLLDSGVPILAALGIVKNVVQNDIIAEAIDRSSQNIRQGDSVAGPLRESGEFPPLVIHMIAIGERTGELEPMLRKVADAYDTEVANLLGTLTTLLEPVIIVAMGIVVGIVALSVLLPMLNLSHIVH